MRLVGAILCIVTAIAGGLLAIGIYAGGAIWLAMRGDLLGVVLCAVWLIFGLTLAGPLASLVTAPFRLLGAWLVVRGSEEG